MLARSVTGLENPEVNRMRAGIPFPQCLGERDAIEPAGHHDIGKQQVESLATLDVLDAASPCFATVT